MSELLKPCPFCGGEAEVWEKRFPYGLHVRCANQKCTMFTGGRLYEELKDAIEAWNRRVKHEES